MSLIRILDFFDKYPEINYQKGDKILRPNEYSSHVYLVKRGYVRIYKLLKTGQDITFTWYHPKKQKFFIFGYTSLLTDYHVEAFTDVDIRRAPKAAFLELEANYPSVKDHVIFDLGIFLEEALSQVEWLSIPDSYTRIKVILHSLAERIGYTEHTASLSDNRRRLEIKITHQLIASFAGLSRETVTIQVNKLVDQGYISRAGSSLVVENLDRLMDDVR